MTEDNQEFKSDGKKRRAHDIFWLILFILVQVGMIVLVIFSTKYGSVDR